MIGREETYQFLNENLDGPDVFVGCAGHVHLTNEVDLRQQLGLRLVH